MNVDVLNVFYMEPSRKSFRRGFYWHNTNHPKLTALVDIGGGNQKMVFVGSEIKSALGKNRISKEIRELVIQNRPAKIEVLPRKDSDGSLYYKIAEESAKLWADNVLPYVNIINN